MKYRNKVYKIFMYNTYDDDYADGHLFAACFFVPRQKVFDFFLIRFKNLKINLTVAHVLFT